MVDLAKVSAYGFVHMTDNRGLNLREWRNRRGYSQDRLAALADVTKATIQNLESGRKQGYGSTWRKLAQVLEIDVALLIPPQGGEHSAAG